MKKIITLTAILVLTLSGLLIGGLVRYNLAINATKDIEGGDIEITDTMYSYGFDLDIFETPTPIDYITSNFK